MRCGCRRAQEAIGSVLLISSAQGKSIQRLYRAGQLLGLYRFKDAGLCRVRVSQPLPGAVMALVCRSTGKSRVKESGTESKSRKASLALRKARRKASQGKQVSRQGKRDATVNVRTQEAIAVLAVSRQGERDQAQHQAQHGFGSSRKARPSSILTRSMVLILPRLSRDQLPAVARQVCRSRDAEDNKTIPAVWCHLVLLSIVLVLRGCLAARLSHCRWRQSC